MNSTLEKKKGGKIIGEKEKARSKRKWREMTGKAQGLTKRPYLNISHRCYIFCNCPSGVALRLLHPRAMHQCNIRMTNKPFFYKAGERRFESYMGGKKKEYWGKKKRVLDLRHHSQHTQRKRTHIVQLIEVEDLENYSLQFCLH